MTTIRKQYSPTFKSQVVQEMLKGEKTINQIASEYGVHPSVIGKWKQAALKAMPASFAEDEHRLAERIAALVAQHEKEKDQLYAEIGRLTTELNWIKKKFDPTFTQGNQASSHRTWRG